MILVVVSFLSVWAAPINLLTLFAGYFAMLFYLLLGVKDLVFLQRSTWYRVLNIGLVYSAFLLFFYHVQGSYVIRAVLIFVMFLLLLERFTKKRAIYWLLALIILEVVWAIGLLPIGFISAASLALAFYFFLTDLTSLYFEEKLTKRLILLDSTIFVALVLIVSGFAKWAI